MQLLTSDYAQERCAAEILPGRRKSDLAETTAMSLEIDDAYAVFVCTLKQYFGRP
jgi:hypothetical protein